METCDTRGWNRFAIRLHYFRMHSADSAFWFFWYERHRLSSMGEEYNLWFSSLFNCRCLYVTSSHASQCSPRHLIPKHPHSIHVAVFTVMTSRSLVGAYLPYCTVTTQKNANMNLNPRETLEVLYSQCVFFFRINDQVSHPYKPISIWYIVVK
jgi:hypothetical protein